MVELFSSMRYLEKSFQTFTLFPLVLYKPNNYILRLMLTKNSPLLITAILMTGLLVVSASCTGGQSESESTSVTESVHQQAEQPDLPLIYHMSFISRYSKKLYFAGEAENWELADIYNHEIEEISEDIVTRGEVHDGINISELMDTMLLPQIEQIEEAIDSGDRKMFMDRYNVMIQTCNQCHAASDYGAVKVIVPETNPFNQDFSTD